MKNLARKIELRHVSQDVGTVLRTEAGGFWIRTDTGEAMARRATSCLVEPAPEDLVLLAKVDPGGLYVLAVLEREEGISTCIAANGDLNVKLPRGRFTVAAQEGVSLASGKDVSVVSAGVQVNAVEGNVALQSLSFLGSVVRAEVEKVKLLAGSFDSILDRLSQRVKRAYRFIEESEHVRAEGQIDYAAKKNMSLRGKNTLVTAQELVKVDGDQIHLG